MHFLPGFIRERCKDTSYAFKNAVSINNMTRKKCHKNVMTVSFPIYRTNKLSY